MMVKFAHARAIPWANKVGYCSHGLRAFFSRHNLDLRDFVRHGLDEEVLMETGDDMAVRLVEFARKQASE